ncbi:hypothetical protein MKW94_015403 [Papaver nudicaule]|uniref:Uncharacterized protein n=1 Tax=Papaver nudicaule TaxID=74823 RepID=A0AA41VDQ5_PAPNU|nr:hypothetical protein [Papaver nudicaule]
MENNLEIGSTSGVKQKSRPKKRVIQKLENEKRREITLGKRKNSLLRKAQELSVLCDAEVAAIVISESGSTTYGYANPSVESIADRYKKACAESSSTICSSQANTEFYQREATKLRRQIELLEQSNRHLKGEALSSLSIKELKQLEGRVEKSISQIQSKKYELWLAETQYMQKKQTDMQNDRIYLQAKVDEMERAGQHMNLMSGNE